MRSRHPPPTATPTATPTPPTPTPAPTPTPSPVPSPTPTPTEAPSPNTAESGGAGSSGVESPAEVLQASLDAMKGVSSFHFAVEGSITPGTGGFTAAIPLTYVGDFKAPDLVRGKLTLQVAFFSVEIETIAIGDAVYNTNPQTGIWETTPGLAGAIPSPPQLVLSGLPRLIGPVSGERDNLDGAPVFRLRGVLPAGFVGESEGEADIWIGAEDLLVRQVAGEGEISLEDLGAALGVSGISGKATIALTVRFSDYGKPVTIEAPQVP